MHRRGWIAAILKQVKLVINKFNTIDDIVNEYPDFDEFFIDMVIGLQSSKNHIRPDIYARQIIKERTSTIFLAPCRQAVYANTVSEAYEENERVLGKKFTPLTVGIIPKIRELDSFFQKNPEYKNIIKESHPEVCFARLIGRTMLSKKSEICGIEERINLLERYIPKLLITELSNLSKSIKCNVDDIVDAICLAVTSNIAAQGYFEIIHEIPMYDETGLLMQMAIPCFEKNKESRGNH
jgi:8-oxo-dGTP diphosphatase